jgi:TonB family protein
MLPHPLSRSAPGTKGGPPLPLPDLAILLEQHAAAGFPLDLALDLVLNELVVRAADATHATAAALALLRGERMVCRAATGLHAPDLGVPLDTRDGLSGACVRTRMAQLSADTESDAYVDPSISRRLGIRSMLVVPVFDYEKVGPDQKPPLTGVLEVFSPLPNTFTQHAQILLADFADECARICRVAANFKTRPPASPISLEEDLISSDTENGDTGAPRVQSETQIDSLSANEDEDEASRIEEPEILPLPTQENDLPPPLAPLRQPYEAWTLILGALVILAAAFFSFMIGSRIGWLRSPQPASEISSQPAQSGDNPPLFSADKTKSSASAKAGPQSKDSSRSKSASRSGASATGAPTASSDELVVYDKDKVIFRMGPTQGKGSAPSPAESANQMSAQESTEKAAPSQSQSSKAQVPSKAHVSPNIAPHAVWLAPAQADSRLLSRVEPQYPADALAAHRSGDVTLEVHVAEDGTVSSVRTLNGDPLLATAAAQAVRNWRYQPYRPKDQPSQFQTDVTLTFSLPN